MVSGQDAADRKRDPVIWRTTRPANHDFHRSSGTADRRTTHGRNGPCYRDGERTDKLPIASCSRPVPVALRGQIDLDALADGAAGRIVCWGGGHHAGMRLPIVERGGDGYTHVLVDGTAMPARRFPAAGGMSRCD